MDVIVIWRLNLLDKVNVANFISVSGVATENFQIKVRRYITKLVRSVK